MKKVLSLLLALVLACGMSVTALADEATIRTTVPQRHAVAVEADGGRVIANNKVCGDTVLIERQKEQTYWIVPDEGKELDRLYYNDEDVTGQMEGSAFTAPALTGDAVLEAVFKDAAGSPDDGNTVDGTGAEEDGNPVPGETADIGGHTGTTGEDGSIDLEAVDDYTRDGNPDAPETATAPVENGSATVTLEDGTKITVADVTGDGLWPVVRPLVDSEFADWFEKCVEPYGTHTYPMDIYFTDSQGVRAEITGMIKVIVETLKDYTEPIVCYVAEDGTVTVMRSSVDGKKITFHTDHNSYYVLAEKVPDTQPGTSGGTSRQIPQTGDTSNLWLWGAVMLLACCGLTGYILFGRTKKQDAD